MNNEKPTVEEFEYTVFDRVIQSTVEDGIATSLEDAFSKADAAGIAHKVDKPRMTVTHSKRRLNKTGGSSPEDWIFSVDYQKGVYSDEWERDGEYPKEQE